jgi:hypothetical protein
LNNLAVGRKRRVNIDTNAPEKMRAFGLNLTRRIKTDKIGMSRARPRWVAPRFGTKNKSTGGEKIY